MKPAAAAWSSCLFGGSRPLEVIYVGPYSGVVRRVVSLIAIATSTCTVLGAIDSS